MTERRLQFVAIVIALTYLIVAAGALAGLWAGDWRDHASGLEHAAPSQQEWLGRDHLGRSISAQLIQSTWTALAVGIGAASAAVLLGAALGVLAAWRGGWIDRLVLWLSSVVSAIPGILLVLVIAAVLEPGMQAIIIAYALVGWVGVYRLARSQTQTLLREGYVEASRAIGSPAVSTVTRHLVPHLSGVCSVQFGLAFVAAVQVEAVLSFLGVGLVEQASWGRMIADALAWDLPLGHWSRMLSATACLAGLAWSVQWLAQQGTSHRRDFERA